MAKAALAIDPEAPIKVKLTGDLDEDILRVAPTRAARPDAWIGVDANQGYDRPTLAGLLPALVQHGVAQLEQPPGRGREAALEGPKRPLHCRAGETAHALPESGRASGRESGCR